MTMTNNPRGNVAGFAVSAAVALLIFAAFNGAADWITRRQPIPQSIESLKRATRIDPLFLGNSTMQAGIKEAIYAESVPGSAPLNRAVGGTGVVEHLLLLKTALKTAPARAATPQKPLTILYGFFDLALSRPAETDKIGGSRAFAYYIESETALRYLAPTLRDKWAFRVTGALPALREKYWLWAQVEKLRRSVGIIGMPSVPAAANNEFGRAADFGALEDAFAKTFTRDCRAALTQKRTTGTLLNPPMQEFFALAREKNVRMIVVSMPMPQSHRERFYTLPEWRDYRTALRSELASYGNVSLIDAAAWVPQTTPDGKPGFADALHLAHPGAEIFTRRMAQELSGVSRQ